LTKTFRVDGNDVKLNLRKSVNDYPNIPYFVGIKGKSYKRHLSDVISVSLLIP